MLIDFGGRILQSQHRRDTKNKGGIIPNFHGAVKSGIKALSWWWLYSASAASDAAAGSGRGGAAGGGAVHLFIGYIAGLSCRDGRKFSFECWVLHLLSKT